MIKKEENISRDESINKLVVTAFFAAITFLGIQIFRVPLPAVVGTPFVPQPHFCDRRCMLLMGGKRGAVSGTLGLVIFDILNGYLQDVPQVFHQSDHQMSAYRISVCSLKKQGRGRQEEDRGDDLLAVLYGLRKISSLSFVMRLLK